MVSVERCGQLLRADEAPVTAGSGNSWATGGAQGGSGADGPAPSSGSRGGRRGGASRGAGAAAEQQRMGLGRANGADGEGDNGLSRSSSSASLRHVVLEGAKEVGLGGYSYGAQEEGLGAGEVGAGAGPSLMEGLAVTAALPAVTAVAAPPALQGAHVGLGLSNIGASLGSPRPPSPSPSPTPPLGSPRWSQHNMSQHNLSQPPAPQTSKFGSDLVAGAYPEVWRQGPPPAVTGALAVTGLSAVTPVLDIAELALEMRDVHVRWVVHVVRMQGKECIWAWLKTKTKTKT